MPGEKRPFLQRFGESYFRRRSKRLPPVLVEDEIYILNPHEQAELKKIERRAILRAVVAGTISALACAIAALLADPLLGPEGNEKSILEAWDYWAIVLGVFLVVCVVEIAFLYWDALRSVHQLTRIAGLDLYPETGTEEGVRNALVQAALEMPAPVSRSAGDETSKLWVILAPILYKAKITLTNFLLKALVRRAMGRVVVRAWIEFIAIPVCAGWNAIVCWWVLREARVRAMGPSAARMLVDAIFPPDEDFASEVGIAARGCIAVVIRRNTALHPNLASLSDEIARRFPNASDSAISTGEAFLKALSELPFEARNRLLQLLAVAVSLDNRLSRWETELYLKATGTTDFDTVLRIRNLFRDGDPELVNAVTTAFRDTGPS